MSWARVLERAFNAPACQVAVKIGEDIAANYFVVRIQCAIVEADHTIGEAVG